MFRRLLALAIGLAALSSVSVSYADDNTVNVLYAGSLVNLMERSVGPAFEKATGVKFQGYGAGSNKVANEIKAKLRRGDVFISASPKVNAGLMGVANGDHVSWFVSFAESPLLIGYNPRSRFADEFKTKPWQVVLQEPGIHIGRTDPKLDPKGAFTVEIMTKAADFFHQPDLFAKTLGSPDNPDQVLPEEALVGRLQSGQLDAGFFYSTETSDLKIPAVRPEPELIVKAGYTLTILNDAQNPAAAIRFVNFLLSPAGRALMKAHGIDVITPVVNGDSGHLPAVLKDTLAAVK